MAGVLGSVLNTLLSTRVVTRSSMCMRWWWKMVCERPSVRAMSTQSCRQQRGVVG